MRAIPFVAAVIVLAGCGGSPPASRPTTDLAAVVPAESEPAEDRIAYANVEVILSLMPETKTAVAGVDSLGRALSRELDMKDAGALKAAGGEAYLPLLYATGPFD